jgi:hypothetical protein
MPFMPEMLQFAGQKLQVSKRAHKTCDPINGLGSRALPDSVHIGDLRCDGIGARRLPGGLPVLLQGSLAATRPTDTATPPPPASGAGCTEQDLQNGTIDAPSRPTRTGPRTSARPTQVNAATRPLPWYRASQYVEDLSSGNTTVDAHDQRVRFLDLAHHRRAPGLRHRHADALAVRPLAAAHRWLALSVAQRPGAKGKPTPALQLDIKEGEFVRTKSYPEILDTLDGDWKNRGLYFDAEMVPYTNKTLKVLKRVSRLIHEKTGKMLVFKSPCMILEGSVCEAKFAKCRKLCPRGYYLYWRDIWVNKIRDTGRPRPARASTEHEFPRVVRLGELRRRIALHAADAWQGAEQLVGEPVLRGLGLEALEQVAALGGDVRAFYGHEEVRARPGHRRTSGISYSSTRWLRKVFQVSSLTMRMVLVQDRAGNE